MAALNRFLCCAGLSVILASGLSGCGGTDGSVPVADADGASSVSLGDDESSGLPTLAVPGPKVAEKKSAANSKTAPAAASTPPKATTGTASKTGAGATPSAAKTDSAAANAVPPSPGGATVAKEPEKGSPDWLLLEIQRIRVMPLPMTGEDIADAGDDENEDKPLTAEQEAKLKEQLDKQRAVRRERNLQIIKLAEECIAKTNKKPEMADHFDTAVHQLLDARLQLALQGDADSIAALYEAASVFYERSANSESALEAQLTLVNLTHANALRYGAAEPKWMQEFAKHAQVFGTRYPEEQARAVPLLAAAARTCELNGFPKEAVSCYTLLMTKFRGTPQAAQAEGVLRRLKLKGKELTLTGTTMDGNDIDIATYRGKMVIVVFWATHARPFIDQLPKLVATAKKYEKYAVVVGVNLDAQEPDVEAFVEKTGLSWPQVFSPNRNERGWNAPLAVEYGINNLPTIWLVDPNGIVAETDINAENLESKLREVYLPYLKSTSVKQTSGGN